MKRIVSLLLLLSAFLMVQAQRYQVQGSVENAQTMAKLPYVSISILQQSDSAFVRGALTDSLGQFVIHMDQPGSYLVRFSYTGYEEALRYITINDHNETADLGIISMKTEENTLAAAIVYGRSARMQQIGDTTQFNASAYRTPTGSTVEALVKQLPGVSVSDDGTIRWNGKTVKQFLLNGKDFFKGDTKTVMKNLPTDIVGKIKAYDKKSDYAQQTGIDDGEEVTVLDISTKKALNDSWITNVDLGAGNHGRYSDRLFATRFTDNSRISLFSSLNNTNDQGFGGPHSFGGNKGLTASKMVGLDFYWDNKIEQQKAGHFEVEGNVRYSHRDVDLNSITSTENFLTSGGTSSFVNGNQHSYSHTNSFWANAELRWNPDSLTFIGIEPGFSHNATRNNGKSRSATFNKNPYTFAGVENPLDSIFSNHNTILTPIAVNRNFSETFSHGNTNTANLELHLVRRFARKGRNVNLRLNGEYTHANSKRFNVSDITYYTGKPASFLNQYETSPTESYGYSARFGYVEPLGKNWYAQVRYEYSYKYQDGRRSLYDLDKLDPLTYGNANAYPRLGTLPTDAQILETVRDLDNSQYATYRYFNNSVDLDLRYDTKNIRFHAGVSFDPQRTKMQYTRPSQLDTLITRSVFNVSPTLRFRYRMSKTNSIDIRYRGKAGQPSMTNLLDVVDNSDPLNISMGNPGLKPSWTNTLRASYYGYNPARQAGIMAHLSFAHTTNSISTRVIYNDATGVRYSRPENINGSWDLDGTFIYNFSFGKNKQFSLSTFTDVQFRNDVGFISRISSPALAPALFQSLLRPVASIKANPRASYYNSVFDSTPAVKNSARSLDIREDLNFTYRASFFDIGLIGTLDYEHTRNSLQTAGNLSTWLYAYGLSGNISLPWGMTVSSDIQMSSRRGYVDRAMNTNELLWNAQIAQSFLRDKSLTLSVRFYDLLHRQSNVIRSVTAQMRRDAWINAVNSYFMINLSYRLNIFNGKAGSREKGEGGRRRGEFPGPPPGGFGGERRH